MRQLRATNIQEALHALDPLPFISEDSIVKPNDPWYCALERHFNPRDYSVTPKIRQEFQTATIGGLNFVHLAIVGHKGTGKSTQVNTAMLELENQGVVHASVDAPAFLDENEFTFSDVVLTIANAVVKTLETRNANIPNAEFNLVKNWFRETLLTTTRIKTLEGEIGVEAQAGNTIPYLAKLVGRISATTKSQNEYRTEIRERASSNTDELVRNLNVLLAAANAALSTNSRKRTIAVVFDNLEKIEKQSSINEAILSKSEELRRLQCHLLFFFDPINQYAPIGKKAGKAFKLILVPNLHMRDKHEALDVVHPNALAAIREVLEKRLDLQKIFTDPDACVLRIAQMSGGRLRDVMDVARQAAEYAVHTQIELADIEYAAKAMSIQELVMLEEKDWGRLQAIHKSKKIEPQDGKFLLKSLVLNYNGQQWFDIHPLVALDERIQNP